LIWLLILNVKGLSEPQIAERLGITTTQLRAKQSLIMKLNKSEIGMAQRVKDKGYSNIAVLKNG